MSSVTPAGGAACGLELAVGDRVGLLLTRDGNVWRSGLCSQVDPADFLALTNVEDNALPPINWGGIVRRRARARRRASLLGPEVAQLQRLR